MLTRGARTAVASTSQSTLHYFSTPTRGFLTTFPTLRQQDRLPHGHVRPLKRAPRRSGLPFADEYEPPHRSEISVPSRPISIPSDPLGVLGDSHAARELLGHETLVIVRQLEMLNVFMGFEQANRYAIMTPEGENVGYLAEEERSIISAVSRQTLRTHRPFRSVVMDKTGTPVLWIKRPFAFINSRIFVHASEAEVGKLVGEAQQQWHPWRRRYNLFQQRNEETFSQFARIDGGFFAWDFWLKDKDDRLVASINRNFRGLGRELFTDTGQYVIRFDSAGTELDLPPGSSANVQGQSLILPSGREGGLTLDQRAMTLATAVSIDFDYFSRHSGSGGMGLPFFMWGGGDGGSDLNRDPIPSQPTDAPPGTGAAAETAGTGSEADIYGQQQQQPERLGGSDASDPGSGGGLEGYGEEGGWVGENDEVMQDPWSQGSDEGFFGGSGGGGGGDWGDWS
ncbi:hypothetical protein P7C73_g1563, partial [Tremellales sp. Uapishka_1]